MTGNHVYAVPVLSPDQAREHVLPRILTAYQVSGSGQNRCGGIEKFFLFE